MKIAIIGATGHAGSAIFKEALKRGHEVTGYVRHPDKSVGILPPDADLMGSQHFFGQFAKRLFVKLGHTRKAMLLVQDSLSVLVPLRGCKRSRCKRRLALSDH